MQLSRSHISRVLLEQEIRGLLVSPPLWGMLIILSLLVGYSFIQAVDLFSQASRTALQYPDLAGGMIPLEGIFVPTFGAYYLVETLLLPFIIIRLIGQDKQNGTLKLLLQLPLSTFGLNAIKLAAMAVVWILILLPGILVLVFWQSLGGHIYWPEILTLLLGHSLYSLAIVCIAMFATAISSSLPTASMICLAATLGSWVLAFAAGAGGWLSMMNSFSLTTLLRQFESGLLSSVAITSFLVWSLSCFIAASVWLHPGRKLRSKMKMLLLSMATISAVAWVLVQMPRYVDVTENHKHSFNPAHTHALQQMNEPLKITVHLSSEDSRRFDLEKKVLSKLRRIVPNLELVFPENQAAGLFGSSESNNYGLIEYEYAGKRDQSYSNSAHEILPLLHALAGQVVEAELKQSYSGYPLIADASGSKWVFYLLLPLIFLLGAIGARKPSLSI